MLADKSQKVNFSEKILKTCSVEEIKNSIIAPYKEILDNLEEVCPREVYIFGAKELGKKFHGFFSSKNIKVLGFLDNDVSKQNTLYCGCNVFSVADLLDKKEEKPTEITVVVASIYYVQEILNQLKDLGFTKVIPCQILYVLDNKNYKAEPSFDGLIEDLAVNKQKYLELYSLLEDEQSKKVFEAAVEFRQTYDFSLFGRILSPHAEIGQYFEEPFIKYTENDIFVDGGGFDGDTALKFINKTNGRYKKILFFEPDEESFLKAKKALNHYKNIEFYNKGLYSGSKTFRFASSGGLGSIIDDSGDTIIETVAIDEILREKASYIKMDIEGAELEALKGSEKQLKHGVQLAISLYHKPQDIWQIPEYIKSVNPQYKFYLRHYTNAIFETVLYAIT